MAMHDDGNDTNVRFGKFGEWLSAGSLSRQFGIIFRTLAIFVVLLGLSAAVGFVRIEQRAQNLANLTDVAFLTSAMNREVNLSKDNMGAFRARNYEPVLIERAIDNARGAQQFNSELRSAAGNIDAAWLPVVDALDSDLKQVETIMEEIRDAPRDIVEEESFLGPRYDFIDATNAKIVGLRDDASGRVEEVSTNGLFEIQAAMAAVALFALLAVGLVFLAQRYLAARVVKPVEKISTISAGLVAGDMSLRIPTWNRHDEIGQMASSLAVMQSYAQEIVDRAQQKVQAQQERNQRVDALQLLADRFEQMVGKVATEVAATSSQLKGAAQQMTDNAQASSQSVLKATDLLSETSRGVTQAASASDEFVVSITEVSRQAASSASRAGEAADAVRDADNAVTQLDKMANQVGAVIELISEIAQRTNLLALNASIEAARGGEAGRGFAVVASEVKELAQQTANATSEVEEQIRLIQGNSSASAAALRKISEQVSSLESTSVSIASAVDQQSLAGQELAQSIDLAARNTEAVSANMETVSSMAVATGAAAGQVLGSCNQLSEQAEMLRQQVTEFLGHVRSA